MKQPCKKIVAMLLVLALAMAIPVGACANAAEPPCFAVVVNNAPEDLVLSVVIPFSDDCLYPPIELRREGRSWETYYRFFYDMLPGNELSSSPRRIELLAETGGESFFCSMEVTIQHGYNARFTLDLKTRTLTEGVSPWRAPLLIALRVGLTFLVEGIVFFLFGYRKKRSWIIFAATNAFTQAALNVLLLGGMSTVLSTYLGPAVLLLGLAEVLIFLMEAAVYGNLLREYRPGRGALCALVANAVSFLLGGLIITYLPL